MNYKPSIDSIVEAAIKRTGIQKKWLYATGRGPAWASNARHVVLAVVREFGYDYHAVQDEFRRDATSYANSVHRVKNDRILSKLADQISNDVWTFDPRTA